MSKSNSAWAEIETQWRECFGEPPPIRASIGLMRKVIRAAQADGYPQARRNGSRCDDRAAHLGCAG